MCKNLSILNLSNEVDDLILEKDASNEHLSVILKIKEGEKLADITVELLIMQNATIP